MNKTKVLTVTATNNVSYQLTEKEKKFCEVYCQYGVSGIEAVREAGYKVASDNVAYSIASEYLRKPKILAYIDTLFNKCGVTDLDIIRAHALLLKQNTDMAAKASAVDMCYKIKGYYRPKKRQDTLVSVDVINYADVPYKGLHGGVSGMMAETL